MPQQCHWSSAPSLFQSQVWALCSWRWGHWRGLHSALWRRWATAHQILRRALPCQLKQVSRSGTRSLWPSSSQVYWQSAWGEMKGSNQTADTSVGYNRLMTHVVIWDSRKMRMKTSIAGTQQANIIHTGKGWCSPNGLISQPLLAGLDTIRPLGTTSFCTEFFFPLVKYT